eukprot:NODE_115_length_19014_cov_0.489664.p11 type:complete len:127 gc:universal NODE_115_length_19014_cov_0.489664:2636-3016(+)
MSQPSTGLYPKHLIVQLKLLLFFSNHSGMSRKLLFQVKTGASSFNSKESAICFNIFSTLSILSTREHFKRPFIAVENSGQFIASAKLLIAVYTFPTSAFVEFPIKYLKLFIGTLTFAFTAVSTALK